MQTKANQSFGNATQKHKFTLAMFTAKLVNLKFPICANFQLSALTKILINCSRNKVVMVRTS